MLTLVVHLLLCTSPLYRNSWTVLVDPSVVQSCSSTGPSWSTTITWERLSTMENPSRRKWTERPRKLSVTLHMRIQVNVFWSVISKAWMDSTQIPRSTPSMGKSLEMETWDKLVLGHSYWGTHVTVYAEHLTCQKYTPSLSKELRRALHSAWRLRVTVVDDRPGWGRSSRKRLCPEVEVGLLCQQEATMVNLPPHQHTFLLNQGVTIHIKRTRTNSPLVNNWIPFLHMPQTSVVMWTEMAPPYTRRKGSLSTLELGATPPRNEMAPQPYIRKVTSRVHLQTTLHLLGKAVSNQLSRRQISTSSGATTNNDKSISKLLNVLSMTCWVWMNQMSHWWPQSWQSIDPALEYCTPRLTTNVIKSCNFVVLKKKETPKEKSGEGK